MRRGSNIACEIDILHETLSQKKNLKNLRQDLVCKSSSKRSKQKTRVFTTKTLVEGDKVEFLPSFGSSLCKIKWIM